MIVGLTMGLLDSARDPSHRKVRASGAVLGAALLIFANLGVVFLLSQVWSTKDGILTHAQRMSPDSPRVQMLLIVLRAEQGDFSKVDHGVLNVSSRFPERAMAAQLLRAQLRCAMGLGVATNEIQGTVTSFTYQLDNDDAETFSGLATFVLEKPCEGVTTHDLTRWGETILNQAVGEPRLTTLAKIEYMTAKCFAAMGDINRATPYAEAAWANDEAPAIAILLFQLYASSGNLTDARKILGKLRTSPRLTETAAVRAMHTFENWLAQQP